MMPAGKYYVGDLCYVMHPQWMQACFCFLKDYRALSGEFALANGVRFARFSTKYGDGDYVDNLDNGYLVDSGCIGCILVSDIDDPNASLYCGAIHEFDNPFAPSLKNGRIYFDKVCIDTDYARRPSKKKIASN